VAQRGRALSAQLEAAQSQLNAVWNAFVPALAQAVAAAQDAAAPLPPVPLWADELRAARGEAPAAEAAAPAPAKPRIDPEQRAAATKAVEAGVMLLEQAVAAGHSKNMNSATQALRQSLKTNGRLIDEALEARVHAALVSAGELGGWQRWSADKAREQLVARAEALLVPRKPRREAAPGDAALAAAAAAESPAAAPAEAAEAPVAEVPADTAAAAEASARLPRSRSLPTPPCRRPSPPPRPTRKRQRPRPPPPNPPRNSSPPWAGASCRRPSASCARSGRPPTRAARPTTRCGSALTAPATPRTSSSTPGWIRCAPSRPSTRRSARP
jgi:hypothetical protein